ncbi:MAG TPA: dipeptidase [Gemmatimonadaceae bacterium]|jgi:Zn-dependent dipeptidase, microsomal dipeptidase homolog
MPDQISERASRVYRDAIVIDTHNDMFTRVLDEGFDPDVRHSAREGHTDIPRLVESGITAQFMAAWVDAPYALTRPDESFARAIRYIDAIHATIERNPDTLILATDAEGIMRAKREGKVAILIGVEGGHAIEDSLEKLRELHRRGACYLTLTWNNGNSWAGSSIGEHETRTGGLTPFGEEVIRELDRLGMLVDLSHVSEETFYDALAVSTRSVITSHSCARSLSDHPRNLTDDQLRAIARNGGVAQLNFFPLFLDTAYREAYEKVEAGIAGRRAASGADPSAPLSDDLRSLRTSLIACIPAVPLAVVLDHIDHMVRVAGIDHVGALGSDFDGISSTPSGLEDVTRIPVLAQALLDRGYSDADVMKLLGGNVMRVMGEGREGTGDRKQKTGNR